MNEIEIMQNLDEILSSMDEATRRRVLVWASSKFGIAQLQTTSPSKKSADRRSSSGASRSKGTSTGKRKKVSPKQIKSLDFRPKNGPSAREFAEQKAPTNHLQKITVAVYYLSSCLGLENVGQDHIYTFYKDVGWPVPADLPNTMSQAGTAGWLDSSDHFNVLITPRGENLVEHDLPAKPKK